MPGLTDLRSTGIEEAGLLCALSPRHYKGTTSSVRHGSVERHWIVGSTPARLRHPRGVSTRSSNVIYVAIVATAAIALCKFVVALLTRSSAMLAEAFHSKQVLVVLRSINGGFGQDGCVCHVFNTMAPVIGSLLE